MARTGLGITGLSHGSWKLDPLHTTIGFAVQHLGLSKVRGRFNCFSGMAEIGADLDSSSVYVSVELSSVDTHNPQRDSHLRSTDFFGVTDFGALEEPSSVERSPWMTFASTNLSPASLVGDLTINGITRSVELELQAHGVVELESGQGLRIDGYQTVRAGFSANGEIRRSDFGIDFNAPLGLDGVLIGDIIEIAIDTQLVPIR